MVRKKKDDIAWPLIGWALNGRDIDCSAFEEEAEFPSVCSVKVVSRGSKKNARQLVESLSVALNRKIELHEFAIESVKQSRFHCIYFHLFMESNEDVRRVYEVIRESETVCYIL